MTRHNSREARCLCSELVVVEYLDRTGREITVIGNLEEIWPAGAVLLLEAPVSARSQMVFHCRQVPFHATVISCSKDFLGYFLEVRFDDGSRWSRRKLRPKHLFRPSSMLSRDKHRKPAA